MIALLVTTLLFIGGVIGLADFTKHRSYLPSLLLAFALGLAAIALNLTVIWWFELAIDGAESIPEKYRLAYKLVGTPILAGILFSVVRFVANGCKFRSGNVDDE